MVLLGFAVAGVATTLSLGFLFTRSIVGLPREQYPLERWIDSQNPREEAIDPDRPIVDAHHHMCDARIHPKGWPISPIVIKFIFYLRPSIIMKVLLGGQDAKVINFFSRFLTLAIPYMIDEMTRDVRNQPQPPTEPSSSNSGRTHHNVQATVYIESMWDDAKETEKVMRTVGEAKMAQELADGTRDRFCTAIIPSVHLTEGKAVRSALEALKERHPNVRGIRDILAYTQHPGLMQYAEKDDVASDPKFREGFALLSEFGFTFDAWGYDENLPSIRNLALAFPETTITLDHCGSPVGFPPYDREEAFERWSAEIKSLAESCPNVMAKLSGLGLPLCGFGFENRESPPSSKELAEVWGRYILRVIECFGVDRCMFASNFPCDKASCSYTSLWNAFKIIAKDFPEEDKRKLFYDNAVRIYELTVPP